MRHKLKRHPEAVAVIILLLVITLMFAFQMRERSDRLNESQRQICAIRAYIEGQYRITASAIAHTPADVIKARRRVIQQFEDRMDGNCK